MVSSHWHDGSAGAVELAETIMRACNTESKLQFLYSDDQPLKTKIETVSREIYGAKEVEYSEQAEKQLQQFTLQGKSFLSRSLTIGGLEHFPVCIAKTHLSFSGDAKLKGCPEDFKISIQSVRANTGAKFICPFVGSISTMPGLPTRPTFYDIDIEGENVIGLS